MQNVMFADTEASATQACFYASSASDEIQAEAPWAALLHGL